MANVVFTTVDALEDIDSATWFPGDNESYERTQKMVPNNDRIGLIGRQGKDGRVLLCYANADGFWKPVNAWHVTLAKFFHNKLDAQTPIKDDRGIRLLRVFFREIDNEQAAHAAQQLIAAECGINVTKERWGKLHDAVLVVQSGLSALGVSCGDWTFEPMFNSFKIAE